MKNSYSLPIFAFVISVLIIFMAGCSVGIKPRSHDVLPEGDVYYEESVHGSYYDMVPRSSTHYYYDPNYDPWTMGTYYQYYSGPPRSGASSGSSSSVSVRSEARRPAVSGRDSTSTGQNKAPASSERASLRNSRSVIRSRGETDSQISSSARRKAKREASWRTSRNKETDDELSQKQKRTEKRQESQKSQQKEPETEEDEKSKKRRKSPR